MTDTPDIVETLLRNCIGTPAKGDPWPHRMLHDAADEITRLRAKLAGVRELVDSQAENDGCWFVARHATEGYLQQELRKLHAAVEAHD